MMLDLPAWKENREKIISLIQTVLPKDAYEVSIWDRIDRLCFVVDFQNSLDQVYSCEVRIKALREMCAGRPFGIRITTPDGIVGEVAFDPTKAGDL